MTDPSSLIVGNNYYSLMFHDPDVMIPCIGTYVYTGKNLRPTDANEDRWWLQDPFTYMAYGSLVDYPKEFHSGVRIVDDHFISRLFSLDGLIAELKELGTCTQKTVPLVIRVLS